MQANFPACLAFTLRYEGGKSNDPRDPGGRTNEGVTQRTFYAWLDGKGRPRRDVFLMTPAERDEIYRSGFWDKVKGDGMAAGVDLAVFDFGVNSGPARAMKAYAKRSSNDAATIVRTVCAGRLSFLHALGTFKTFGRGWTARVAACEATGVKMAEHVRVGLAPDAPTAPQVATTLKVEAKKAEAKAAASTKTATASASVGAAAGATQTPGLPEALHMPWPLLTMALVALGSLVGLLMLHVHQQRARAAAYAAVAKCA